MGLFKRGIEKAQAIAKGKPPLVVDPKDLRLPKAVPTTTPGVMLTRAKGSQNVDIDIVGESFRAEAVAAVATAAAGKWFDIYLMNDPNNQYDKNAVAVFAGGLQVGYLAKSESKKWSTRVNAALGRNELITGEAHAVSKNGNTGIFGYIYFGK